MSLVLGALLGLGVLLALSPLMWPARPKAAAESDRLDLDRAHP